LFHNIIRNIGYFKNYIIEYSSTYLNQNDINSNLPEQIIEQKD